jgi:hypothetical protein
MAVLAEQKIARTGTQVVPVAAAVGGDSFVNTGYQRIRAVNVSGGPLTINVDTPNPDNFGVVNNALDETINVPAGQTIDAGPFDPARHNDANNRTQLTYPGGVTGLTIAVTS